MVAVHEPVPWPMGGTEGYRRRWALPMLGSFPGTEGERRWPAWRKAETGELNLKNGGARRGDPEVQSWRKHSCAWLEELY